MTVLALIGATALYLLYGWLASAIVASLLSGQKGYGEKAGLATGLLLSGGGVIVWLFWPSRPDSRWARNPHSRLIAAAYSLAVVIPIVGLVMGIFVATRRDDQRTSRQGVWIIVTSIAAAVIWFLLLG
jgi:FtsH-binding integral membrane protein